MKNNKINLDNLFNYKKFFFLIPVVLLLIAVITGVLFGFNCTQEFKNQYSFTVYYNDDLSNATYNVYQDKIDDMIGHEFDGQYSIEKVNDYMRVGTTVNIVICGDKDKMLTNIENTCDSIEAVINDLNVNSFVRITDVSEIAPISYMSQVYNLLIALSILLAVAFVYIWIRFELKSAISSLLIMPYVSLSTLSLATALRVPFTPEFSYIFIFIVALAYMIYIVLFDNIRKDLLNSSKTLNNEYITNSMAINKNILFAVVCGIMITMVLLCFAFSNIFFNAILLILGIMCAIFTSLLIAPCMWTIIYKRSKDKRLQNRINLKAKREQEKSSKTKSNEDEKIIV